MMHNMEQVKMTPRVAVVGLGSIGSQVLYQLAKSGAEVVGFETYTPGHDRGAGAGETRIFRSAHFEDSRWVPLLTRADQLWDQLSAETGRQLRSLDGCILMGPRDHGQLATALQSVEDHDLDHELMDLEELEQRFPQFRGYDGDVAILDRRAGSIRPELAIVSTTLLAEQFGATVRKRTEVTDLIDSPDGVTLRMPAGSERFDQVVVTAGPWITRLLPALSDLITIRRPISAWFPRKDPSLPWEQTFIRTGPRHCYVVPSPDGVSAKVGLSVVDHMVVDDPDSVQRNVRLDELDPFIEVLDRYVPGLIPDPIRVTSYLEGYVDDARPIIHRGAHSSVTVMGGFSGHGFKLAPAFGEIGRDLALTGSSDLPIDFLSRDVSLAR